MLHTKTSFEKIVADSERNTWSLDQVIPAGTRLDCSKRMVPEALISFSNLEGYDRESLLLLNHLVAVSYMNFFAFLEEFIVNNLLETCSHLIYREGYSIRSVARMLDEELKHQQLFERMMHAIQAHYGRKIALLNSSYDIGNPLMEFSKPARDLAILHFELTTQQHYLDAVHGREGLEPYFQSALKHHFIEEVQHANIDYLLFKDQITGFSTGQKDVVFEDYVSILNAIDCKFQEQAALDARNFISLRGDGLPANFDSESLTNYLWMSYRRLFLTSTFKSPDFVSVIQENFENPDDKIQELIALLGG